MFPTWPYAVILINKGFNFLKSNIKWFAKFIYHQQDNNTKHVSCDISDTTAYCYLAKSNNPSHLKGIIREYLCQLQLTTTWNLFITIIPVAEMKSFFYIKHDKLPKLLKLFINHINTPCYNGKYHITFEYNLLIPSLLYIFQHTTHRYILDSILTWLSYTLQCDHLKPSNTTIFDSLCSFNTHNNLTNKFSTKSANKNQKPHGVNRF